MEVKEVLVKSFEKLLRNEKFEDITVQKIVDDCGLSRMTFYRNFKDKYDLMSYIFTRTADEFFEKYPDSSYLKNLLIEVVELVYSKKDYILNIFKFQGQNSFQETIFNHSMKYFYKNAKISKDDPLYSKAEYAEKMYSAGLVYLMEDWVSHNFKDSPELVAEAAYAALPEIVIKAFTKLN